jgi:hypothetical protein
MPTTSFIKRENIEKLVIQLADGSNAASYGVSGESSNAGHLTVSYAAVYVDQVSTNRAKLVDNLDQVFARMIFNCLSRGDGNATAGGGIAIVSIEVHSSVFTDFVHGAAKNSKLKEDSMMKRLFGNVIEHINILCRKYSYSKQCECVMRGKTLQLRPRATTTSRSNGDDKLVFETGDDYTLASKGSLPDCELRIYDERGYIRITVGVLAESPHPRGLLPPKNAAELEANQIRGVPKLLRDVLNDPTYKGRKVRVDDGVYCIRGENPVFADEEDRDDPDVDPENIYHPLQEKIREGIFGQFKRGTPVYMTYKSFLNETYYCYDPEPVHDPPAPKHPKRAFFAKLAQQLEEEEKEGGDDDKENVSPSNTTSATCAAANASAAPVSSAETGDITTAATSTAATSTAATSTAVTSTAATSTAATSTAATSTAATSTAVTSTATEASASRSISLSSAAPVSSAEINDITAAASPNNSCTETHSVGAVLGSQSDSDSTHILFDGVASSDQDADDIFGRTPVESDRYSDGDSNECKFDHLAT